MAIFITAQTLTNQIKHACIVYNWVINLLGISRNDLKDIEDTLIIVFGIKIDTKSFIARFPVDKLEKAIKTTRKILAEQLVTFLDI